ncbi:hypothetical protein CLAFUW4_09025 [Fulvia fulva]|uniref:Uncharacterized protein n=1 Tax=Passalora fulva TaxID=5499 RepID=A0A9Q8UT12_PASFU|nr:uncharacterized protein CLAFUR5_09134 [Fulvia fulva]KAK4613809.1 hypothetical protein CLAFUR4_09031 [Fulvia fulva]KAK4615013.1 hypothetical protein CLAFUR0_09023 [Fulvia fulva]UJO21429.1 hypothetical protein CLAFUR5_09134 [Fulvia fulva]WPV20080.1 hypothetical protein CLAFUW4_09025 [Fulvia fulva]WPV35477.1 hypothetical protein CLAFUW7_09026 [Fulvia fulva]
MAKLANLVPLVILFLVVAVGGFIGYSIYTWSNELQERGKKKMEKKNMSFTKEGGLRVGVKEVKDEKYADKTQNVLVNVWNNAELPNYKSSLGWNSTQGKNGASTPKSGTSSPRPSGSRSNTGNASGAHVASGEQRRAAQSPSTPGGWN